MEKKLQVKDLRISFRTSNGKVQAVRDISFDLAKGETLAIVGESGSGKSVTSKAILGIQAGNAITESGEIIYDGKDLLKISEEEFHKIRGDKIAMIFQDPMSSLDPIVKIGSQLTEAMILKGKARQRESKETFNTYLKALNTAMIETIGQQDAQKLTAMCKNFDKFEFKHIALESDFNTALQNANGALEDMKVLIYELEKNAGKDATYRVGDIVTQANGSVNPYVVSDKQAKRIQVLAKGLPGLWSKAKKENHEKKSNKKPKKNSKANQPKASQLLLKSLYEMRDILTEAVAKPAPNFFRMGYYVTFSGQPLPNMGVEELNAYLKTYLDDHFMREFIANAKKALEHTAQVSYENMEKAIAILTEQLPVFAEEQLDKKKCQAAFRRMADAAKATIDPLATTKDSLIHTFPSSVQSEIDTYFEAIPKNKKAIKVYEKNKRKHDRLTARGKNPDWQVAAASVTDLELVKSNIAHLVNRLVAHYQELLSLRDQRDYDQETVGAIDHLMVSASGVVAKVTKRVAKARAIKLMEEVGIAEPHRRYNQYPFEFSGGMRQRIVIAIALAANPDVLICDEPTTALDVTIQSQILELINKLKRERQLSVIFITHDLGVVANMADRVAVMYAGKIVEYGTAEDVFYHAAHPYTWALLSSMPDLDTDEKLEAIPGTPPNMIYPPVGDAFAARNKYAMQIDFEQQPPMFQISESHYAATWLLHPDAPKVDPPKAVRDRIERMTKMRGIENAE